jgi:hypothetical protein
MQRMYIHDGTNLDGANRGRQPQLDECQCLEWVLITKTNFDPEDTHFKAAALHHVRQLNRCLAALRKGLH